MPRRVSLIILLSLVIVLVLGFGISALAEPGGALAMGSGQVGKPHVEATDGPNMFSCTGLMRFLLRNNGGPQDAPWDPYAYLSAYPARQGTPQAGDVVVGQGYVGMATGDGNVLMSNAATGVVGYYPMSVMEPIAGVVNPWVSGGANLPATGGNLTDTAANGNLTGSALNGNLTAPGTAAN